MFPKGSSEYKILSKLNTPQKIQSFLEAMPFNHEEEGETCQSVRGVLQSNKAHCLEGAFVACAALILSGRKPLIVSLKVKKPDDDHIIILFKENGYYGALSKTNHAVLRYRDPVYRTVRELVMPYFHEYFLYKDGTKTLIGYTKPINLNRYGRAWLSAETDVWEVGNAIYKEPTISIVPKENKKYLRKVTPFELGVLKAQEWPPSGK
jgi:hypothetical protein